MTKLYVFTGFLGSGKTTLLSGLMRRLEDKKIGVIQNEFGKLGIDGEILNRNSIEMVEINQGSIFCSCLKLQFVEALTEMAEKDFQYLFVESSGLGDPSNIEEILNVVREVHGKDFDFSGILCLVDAVNFLDQVKDEETVNRQLKHCHLAVISKTDLVNQKHLAKIEAKIREINPICRIEYSHNGTLSPEFLNDDLKRYQWAEGEDSLNSEDKKPKTLVMNFSEPFPRDKFELFVSMVADDIYRVKGFAEIIGAGWQQIDIVGRKIDYKPCTAKEKPQLTIISKIGPAIIKPLISAWNETVKTRMELKN